MDVSLFLESHLGIATFSWSSCGKMQVNKIAHKMTSSCIGRFVFALDSNDKMLGIYWTDVFPSEL